MRVRLINERYYNECSVMPISNIMTLLRIDYVYRVDTTKYCDIATHIRKHFNATV